MNGVYLPEAAQCPVCGYILPAHPEAAKLLEWLGLLDTQGLCHCHPGKQPPTRGLARVVDKRTGEIMDMPGLRHKRE